MQNTENQARGSGIHTRHNPTNDKTVSDDLQNISGNIVAPTRYRLTKLGEQMARLPIDPKIARILIGSEEARLHGGNIGDCVRAVDSRPARAAAGSGGTLGIAAADLLTAIGIRCG